ncbi:Gp49 family protein [Lelliottia wanjuensis]|uniref:Gp49 family protein n=1 Tax=Lelliottia wanjuensis TaxID=3050585 RepID=UPI00254F6B9E|nr:Gp49 family protein [Lelliottia sp. V106_16]MDK9358429.1 Gp49 family protein [Lelliottia sp. V106_16]
MVSTAQPAPSCTSIEKEIQAKVLTAPRVTPDHIASLIRSEVYFTGTDGAQSPGAHVKSEYVEGERILAPLDLLTFCVLVLRNGFTVTGESACASPENFDAEIGRKIARENAVNKIWMLEGYLLKQRLHDDRSDVWENEDDCRRALEGQ